MTGRNVGSKDRRRIGRAAKVSLAGVALFFALAATGCGDKADKGAGTDEADGPADTEAGETADGLPVTPPEDASDEPLDEQFVSLAETGAPVADLLKFIRTFADTASPVELSAMLLILEEKQLEQGYALEDRFYEEQDVQGELFDWYVKHERLPRAEDLPDGPVRKLLEDVEAGGFKVETAEGFFFPVIDYEVYKQFQSRVTEDVRAYIGLMAKESGEPAVKDAALIIPWEEVARRALAFEAFIAQYPESARAAAVDRLRMDYTYITFKGIDNSPLFERDGGPVVKAVLDAYKNVLAEQDNLAKKGENATRKNGKSGKIGTSNNIGTTGNVASDSRYLADLREFVRLIEAGGGKQTDEVKAFQEKVTDGLLDEYEERYGDIEQEAG